jgi:Na+-transporting NADH:ubiquinone oxidoreductase subunit C
MSGKLRERAYTVVFMAVITAVCISVLSVVHAATRERIALNERLVRRRAVLLAAGLSLPGEAAAVEALFLRRVEELPASDGTIERYRVRQADGDRTAAWVLPGRGPGLWGTIAAMVGLEPDARTLIRVEFIEQNETPGLGARISEERFREQFRGKRGPLKLQPEGRSTAGDEFDAITGATITSTAVRDIVNRALEDALRAGPAGGGG